MTHLMDFGGAGFRRPPGVEQDLPAGCAEVRLEGDESRVFGWLASYAGERLPSVVVFHRYDRDWAHKDEAAATAITNINLPVRWFARKFTDHELNMSGPVGALEIAYERGEIARYATRERNAHDFTETYRWRAIMVPPEHAEFVFDLKEFIPA